jgi:hypothetical protein
MSHPLYNHDLFALIASPTNITKGADYKTIITTCRDWYNAIASPERVHAYMNVISTLIARQPTIAVYNLFKYYAYKISANSRINAAFIRDFSDKLNWKMLSKHVCLDIDLVREFNIQWKRLTLVNNPTYTIELFNEYSRINMNIFLQNYQTYEYHILNYLHENDNPTAIMILQHIHILNTFEDVDNIFLRPAIIDLFPHIIPLLDDLDIKVAHNNLSQNKHLTPAFIREHVNLLNWELLSENRALTLELIYEHITRIDWESISKNPNIDVPFIHKYYDKIEHLGLYVSKNPNLTREFICDFWRNNLYWPQLQKNRAFTLDLMEEFVKNLDHAVLKNPNMTFEFAKKHIDLFKKEII